MDNKEREQKTLNAVPAPKDELPVMQIENFPGIRHAFHVTFAHTYESAVCIRQGRFRWVGTMCALIWILTRDRFIDFPPKNDHEFQEIIKKLDAFFC